MLQRGTIGSACGPPRARWVHTSMYVCRVDWNFGVDTIGFSLAYSIRSFFFFFFFPVFTFLRSPSISFASRRNILPVLLLPLNRQSFMQKTSSRRSRFFVTEKPSYVSVGGLFLENGPKQGSDLQPRFCSSSTVTLPSRDGNPCLVWVGIQTGRVGTAGVATFPFYQIKGKRNDRNHSPELRFLGLGTKVVPTSSYRHSVHHVG